MTKEYKRFYYQQKPLLNSHVVAKKVRCQVLGPSVRAVVERGKTQSSRPPAEKDGYWVQGWGTNTLRDSEEFRENLTLRKFHHPFRTQKFLGHE